MLLKVSHDIMPGQEAWDRLRRIVMAKGSYLKPKNVVGDGNESSDSQ